MAQPGGVWLRLRIAWRWLKAHGYHMLFGMTILALAALVSWWSVFIRSAIEQQHAYKYESMQDNARILALSMGHNRWSTPAPGQVAQDARLQIVATDDAAGAFSVTLAPFWSEYSITPLPEYIEQIEHKFRRQITMVIGESSVLLLVIIISSVMLYRLIWLERRSSRELKEFWSRLTHEIKTPITGIKAFLQTVEQREFSREELAPLVKMALREVERQEMLAENLLVGQRIEREGLGLQLKQFKLAQHVRDFFDEHRIIIPEGALTLRIDCDADMLVLADPDGLWVILENLVDNALKYGGREPRITCEVTESGGQAKVVVSDTGTGFRPEHAERIFDAYHRLTQELPGGRHGTGMGLYLSRRLACKMGGNLRAESEGPGRGARFTVTLKKV